MERLSRHHQSNQDTGLWLLLDDRRTIVYDFQLQQQVVGLYNDRANTKWYLVKQDKEDWS